MGAIYESKRGGIAAVRNKGKGKGAKNILSLFPKSAERRAPIGLRFMKTTDRGGRALQKKRWKDTFDRKRKMKITVVCDVYGRENNGSDIVASNLVNYLREAGHEVRVLCADQTKIGVPEHYVVPNLSLGKPLNAYVSKVGVAFAKPDREIIRAAFEGVEIVHIMLPLPLGLAAVNVAREMGIPVTAGFHMQAENLTSHLKLTRFGRVNRFVYRFIHKHLYRYCDAIHFPTTFIRGAFERAIGRKTPGWVISNGVHSYVKKREIAKPEQFEDKIVILTTGRYATEKSQDTLIKAVARSRHREEIQLILGGEGPKEKRYKRLAAKLPIPPIFKFYSRKEIIDVLNCADIYVHPAQIELEGIACIEAIACGKLTIVSDSAKSATRGFAVDERCVFRSRDPKDLARVIDYWIEHPEEKAICEEKYLRSAVAFDQEECMQRMEEMILGVLEERRRSAAVEAGSEEVKTGSKKKK